MSGIDEQRGILPCPKCDETQRFTWWKVYSVTRKLLGFLNYRKTAIKQNGEFNLEVDRDIFLKDAYTMTCAECGRTYSKNDAIFTICMCAVDADIRRKGREEY